MGTKVFDLFFSRKGALTKAKYAWPRLLIAIIMLATEWDAYIAFKTNRMLFGRTYLWLDIILYIILLYSTYALDVRRLRDMGQDERFASYALAFLVFGKITPPLVSLLFNLPLIVYFYWLVSTPSRPAVEVFGVKVTYDAYERLKDSYETVRSRQEEVGEEAFREEVLQIANEAIEKATELLGDPRLPEDEKALMKKLLEKAELAKKELEEEEEDEDEKK